MPTVMLTTTCPNECPWCFARPKMTDCLGGGVTEMIWEDFLKVVDFYERSGVRHMTLLGGEPTSHSRILDILSCLESGNFSIQVGTNGRIPGNLVDSIRERHFSRLSFFVNSTSFFDYPPAARSEVDIFLQNAGYPVRLSYTISDRDVSRPSINPVLDRMALIARRSLLPHLQLQIAVPCAHNESYVSLDKYRALLDLLAKWSTVLRKNGFTCDLDCHSIPLCEVSQTRDKPFPYKSACEGFMIDIGPGPEVWPCFPLSDQTYLLSEFKTFADIRARFRELRESTMLGYEPRCADCEHRKERTCDSGCWGFQHLRKGT